MRDYKYSVGQEVIRAKLPEQQRRSRSCGVPVASFLFRRMECGGVIEWIDRGNVRGRKWVRDLV